MTVTPPQSQCTTSGTVAIPHFHFYAGWKGGAPAFFSVDWILIEELTNEHEPQFWYLSNPQGSSGFPYRCTMPPVSDPENWNWTTWDLAGAMIGFAMHNTAYRVTVQWRYGVYMKGPRGPFQTSITINVQNMVVNSGDEKKLLKWDPERPEICDTTFSYNIECAQRKSVSVKISIYSTEGHKVYEVTEQKICPGSYSFTWDGTVNMIPPPPPPNGKARKGLYSFDIQVVGPAYHYDADWLRSRAMRVGEHKVKFITPRVIEGWYVLYSNRDASEAWMEVYDPDLTKVTEATGTTHAIPENTMPTEQDWNKTVRAWARFDKVGTWRFVFWARDNFPEFNKAHRRKLTIACNQKQVDWMLNGGFDYGPYDLNTTQTASKIATIIERIGYKSYDMKYSTVEVMQQIADLACNNSETKNGRGLISFTGHGGGFWESVRPIWVERHILHHPGTDCARFPDRKALGANPIESYECPRKFYKCPVTEYDVENIRNYIEDEERKEQNEFLSNVLIAIWYGCFTGVTGDFSQKLKNLGVKTVVCCKVAMGGLTGPVIMYWDELIKNIWKHLSHGATLQTAIKKAWEDFIGGEYAYKDLWILFNPIDLCDIKYTMVRARVLRIDGDLRYQYDNKLLLLTSEVILRIEGDNNVRIIDPNDPRAKQARYKDKCRCVEEGG